MKTPQTRNFAHLRRKLVADDVELTLEANAIIERIPSTARPTELVRGFPRIVNRIASLWLQPQAMARYLDSLLLDTRGDRSGFPPAVLSEILRLQAYYERTHGQ